MVLQSGFDVGVWVRVWIWDFSKSEPGSVFFSAMAVPGLVVILHWRKGAFDGSRCVFCSIPR